MEKIKRKTSLWDKVKRKGSRHYRGGVEPIDLFRHGHLLYPFALANIIKYAYRSRDPYSVEKVLDDMDKVIHYAEMVKATVREVVVRPNLPESMVRVEDTDVGIVIGVGEKEKT